MYNNPTKIGWPNRLHLYGNEPQRTRFMDTQLIEADDRLATVFSHVYVVQQPLDASTVRQQLLPNYEMLLVLNFGSALPVWVGDASYTIRRLAVIGPLQKLLRYDVVPGSDLLVVVFTLNGFYRLFGKTVQQRGRLAGLSSQVQESDVSSAEILLNQDFLADLWVPLAPLSSTDDRIQRISEYALQHVAPADEATRTLLDTIPYFQHTLVDPVKAVAGQRHRSARSIQLRFQRQLGYSAKDLARFLRFKKLITQLLVQYPALPDWSEMVFTYGYHDQSHLIRDFQHFTGLTPSAFINQLADQTLCMSQPGKFY